MRLPFKKQKSVINDVKEITLQELGNTEHPWFNIREFSLKHKVTTQTVYNWIRSGKIEGGTFHGMIFTRIKK